MYNSYLIALVGLASAAIAIYTAANYHWIFSLFWIGLALFNFYGLGKLIQKDEVED